MQLLSNAEAATLHLCMRYSPCFGYERPGVKHHQMGDTTASIHWVFNAE
jgi:hypothetical protein